MTPPPARLGHTQPPPNPGRFTHNRLDIRSHINTMRKHGVNVLTGIHAALTGSPWRPPDPTPA